ncbi:hypothetical protein D3C81_2238710 [compost metagenome]
MDGVVRWDSKLSRPVGQHGLDHVHVVTHGIGQMLTPDMKWGITGSEPTVLL